MKTLFVAALAALLVACAGDDNSSTRATLDLQDYRGRWLVVNYWAKWCKPCIKEIPELNSLNEKYPQVAVLGIDYDAATGAELQKQIETLGITFPVLLQEPSAQLGIELPAVLPTTLIINPDGKLVQTLVGPQTIESLALATGQIAIPDADPDTEDLVEQRP